MLQELADKSGNYGLKMNNSKTKAMVENDTPIGINNTQSRTLKATYTWDRDAAPEIETKTRRFKEVSRPGGQHSPSTATSSAVTLEHA